MTRSMALLALAAAVVAALGERGAEQCFDADPACLALAVPREGASPLQQSEDLLLQVTARSGAVTRRAEATQQFFDDPWGIGDGMKESAKEEVNKFSSEMNKATGNMAVGGLRATSEFLKLGNGMGSDDKGAESVRNYADEKAKDPEKFGKEIGTNIMRPIEDVAHDVRSHEIEICFLTIGKNGVSTEFNKCNVGLSCQDCKYFKVEIRMGLDFCKGRKGFAKTEFALLSKGPIPMKGQARAEAIFDIVVSKMPADKVFPGLAGSMAEGVIETIAENGGVATFSMEVEFQYEFYFEMATGAGATFDAQTGEDLCNSGWRCYGLEVSGETGLKYGGKFFVCFQPNRIRIEIGAGPFTGVLDLTYMVGLDMNFRLNTNNIGSLTVEQKCMAEPQWKSEQQDVSDGLCVLHSTPGPCKSPCYWAKPVERRKACFATKTWKDMYPGNKDGWCPLLTTEHDCINYVHCVWSTAPCEQADDCKDGRRLSHDAILYITKKMCLATPEWKAKHARPDYEDGLCPFAEDQKACESSEACYWSTRAARKKGCYLTKDSRRDPEDCSKFTTWDGCKTGIVWGHCHWSVSPFLEREYTLLDLLHGVE